MLSFLLAAAGALPLQQLGHEPSLAHVEAPTNMPGAYAGVPSVLRWWCGDEDHAAGPLCVRHEIALQVAKAYGAERRFSQEKRHSLLGDAAMRELKHALAVFCERTQNSTVASNTNARGICADQAGDGLGGAQSGPPPRAAQLIEMNGWWCAQPGHNESIGCRRHAMQLTHQQAASAPEREEVRLHLEELLATATIAELESLREDTRAMQTAYCAAPERAALELCQQAADDAREHPMGGGVGGARSRPGPRGSRKGKGKGGGGARAGGKGCGGKGGGGGKRRPARQYSSPEAFDALKEWWCVGPVPHASDSRCAPSIAWSKKVAQGVRYVFCDATNASFPAALQLCDTPTGTRGAGSSRAKDSRAADKARASHRPGVLRLTGVCALLFGLLLGAVACGWNLKKHVGGKRPVGVSAPVRAVAISSARTGVRSRLGKRLPVVYEVPTTTGTAVPGGSEGAV